MKLRDLIRHLENYGCGLLREGGNHTFTSIGKRENQLPFRAIER